MHCAEGKSKSPVRSLRSDSATALPTIHAAACQASAKHSAPHLNSCARSLPARRGPLSTAEWRSQLAEDGSIKNWPAVLEQIGEKVRMRPCHELWRANRHRGQAGYLCMPACMVPEVLI
jgi:hypothetical protein